LHEIQKSKAGICGIGAVLIFKIADPVLEDPLPLNTESKPTSEDQSEDLLFAALCEVLGSASGAERAVPDAESSRDVLARAGKEFLDLMVARGLQCLGAPEAATDLKTRGERSLRRALILEHDRISVNSALEARGIDHLFFKGALSDPLWWGGQGMRGASDIDILIPRSAEEQASLVLQSLGYERKRSSTHPATEDASKERLFQHSDIRSHFPVDLHLGLLNDPPYFDPANEVFERAVVYETASGKMRGPCREDMLLLGAGNLGQSGFAERTKLVVDAACLLSREKPDLETVASRAAQWRVKAPLWGLLRLVEVRLHISVPGWLLDRLAPMRPLKGIIERIIGVHSSPWHPAGGIKLILAGWPLTGHAFWPLTAARHWARLRISDRTRHMQQKESV
jgi:hypothetical protein